MDELRILSQRFFKLEFSAVADKVKSQAITPDNLQPVRSAPVFVYASLCHFVPNMVQVRESEAL